MVAAPLVPGGGEDYGKEAVWGSRQVVQDGQGKGQRFPRTRLCGRDNVPLLQKGGNACCLNGSRDAYGQAREDGH